MIKTNNIWGDLTDASIRKLHRRRFVSFLATVIDNMLEKLLPCLYPMLLSSILYRIFLGYSDPSHIFFVYCIELISGVTNDASAKRNHCLYPAQMKRFWMLRSGKHFLCCKYNFLEVDVTDILSETKSLVQARSHVQCSEVFFKIK